MIGGNMYSRYSRQVNQQRKEGCQGQDVKDSVASEEGSVQETLKGVDNDDVVEVEDQTKEGSNVSNGREKETQSLPGSDQQTQETCANLSLGELWERLCNPPTECRSLLKKHLTPELFVQLRDRVTAFGGRLEDCIRSGCENTDSGVGVYASDPDAYTVFAPLLDAVIKDYHKVSELNHPNPDFGDVTKLGFGDLDPSGNLIVSTRVRVGRSHDSYGFPPVLTKEDRVEMERKTVEAFKKLDGELKGTYHPLTGMTKETQKQLTEDHFLFNDSDRFLRAAGGYNDWPTGRGIFFNDNKTFLVWVNEEDHLRFISMQKGGNLQEVYVRLVKAIKALEGSGLSFAKRQGLGYLTFCPSNLGTTLRASVHIKIPKLAASPDFKAFCDKYNIQARGIHGEHTESVGGVYDISNKRRLGLTEIDAIQEMRRGVEAVIAEEKRLGGGN